MQVKLLKEADRLLRDFHCGNESIDRYFRCEAVTDDDAATYCFLDDDLKTIIALSSLSCNGIIFTIRDKIYTAPAIEIKMFAVNEVFKHKDVPDGEGMHWSDYCLDITIEKATRVTEMCGASRIFLCSVPNAVNFYKRHGFQDFGEFMHMDDRLFLEGCTPMFMPI